MEAIGDEPSNAREIQTLQRKLYLKAKRKLSCMPSE